MQNPNDIQKREERKAEQRRRERARARWLVLLSWTTPVVAFFGFFSLWHNLGSASTTSSVGQGVAASNVAPTQSFNGFTRHRRFHDDDNSGFGDDSQFGGSFQGSTGQGSGGSSQGFAAPSQSFPVIVSGAS